MVVVVGDPARAREAAERLERAREIGSNREYLTLRGEVGGRDICVVSHGVGAAGANVCFMELLRGGVRAFIRAGTCGAIAEGISDGDLIVAGSAVREDAVSEHFVPLAYPAVADRGLSAALAVEARGRSLTVHEGMIVTEANFYPVDAPPRWERYRARGPIAVEMELSSLFVLASLHGARAAGILAVDGNLVESRDPDMTDYDPHRPVVSEGVAAMLDVAVAVAGRAAAEGDE